MKKIYAVATESDVVLAFESRSDADEYAGEHDGMAVLPVPCVGAYEYPSEKSARGGAMTNWEHLFGTPERAIHTETEFHSWPFFIAVYETSRMSSCTTSKRLLASFCEEADYLEWLKAEYDDGTVEWEER